MALFKAGVDKWTRGGMRDLRLTSSTDYLFNNKLVDTFYQISANTWFYYNSRDGRREKPDKIRYVGGKDAFRALVDVRDDMRYLLTTVTKMSNPSWTHGHAPNLDPPASKMTFRVDSIIFVEADPTDSNFSWLHIKEAPFREVVYKVPHTLDEILEGQSQSGSLS